jgi:hypothetical protein
MPFVQPKPIYSTSLWLNICNGFKPYYYFFTQKALFMHRTTCVSSEKRFFPLGTIKYCNQEDKVSLGIENPIARKKGIDVNIFANESTFLTISS